MKKKNLTIPQLILSLLETYKSQDCKPKNAVKTRQRRVFFYLQKKEQSNIASFRAKPRKIRRTGDYREGYQYSFVPEARQPHSRNSTRRNPILLMPQAEGFQTAFANVRASVNSNDNRDVNKVRPSREMGAILIDHAVRIRNFR